MQALIIDKVVLFGDDYYYTTFFYQGWGYFISENTEHWLYTNGRSLVHILDELLLLDGTIIMWKIFAVCVISLLALFSALISSRAWERGLRTESFKLSLIISCVCISFISIFTANQTLYWATGFLNYVYPILLTLMLFYYTEEALAKERFGIPICLLSFFACSSTEQNAFVSICILLFTLVRVFLNKKKPSKVLLTAVFLGAVGFVLLFFAPGNSVRTTYYEDFYSMPLFDRVYDNILRLSNLIFRKSGADRALVIFFGAAAYAYAERYGGVKRVITVGLNSLSAVFLLINMHFELLTGPTVIISALAFVVCVIISLFDFVKTKKTESAFFIIMAAVAQGAMLISPEMGPRTLIISVIFLIIPTSIYVCETKKPIISCLVIVTLLSFMTVAGPLLITLLAILVTLTLVFAFVKKLRSLALPAAFLIITLLILDSLGATLNGYTENYAVHKENEALLLEYRETLSDGGEHILRQKYLPNGIYKYTMPYDDTYHLYWFKVAMKIPTDTDVRYE